MSVIEINSSLQLMPSASQRMSKVILNHTQTPMRFVDLAEALQLSQFATVFVLVPETLAHVGNAELIVGESDSPGGPPAGLDTLEFFNKAASRAKTRGDDQDFEFGDVKVNFSTMEASRLGESLKLTTLEFKTLKYLIQNARRVISRDELLNEVWGYENYPTTRTVDNQVLKLRKKLERDTSRPIHFQTVHGAGYKFLP